MEQANTYTAFEGGRLINRGPLPDVVLGIKRRMGRTEHTSALIFSDATGNTMDFNFQGTEKDVLRRLEVFVKDDAAPEPENPGPGRPRLGVVSREVSLLPRQWEWLASQSGGASAVLRRLVDEAKRKSTDGNSVNRIQERTYKFMFAIAGDLPGYEEAIRALYKKDRKAFAMRMEGWPEDVKAHALDLAGPVFEAGAK
ncbi:MAG: hypothetical protein JWP91_4375 [Fibrobacteres bacterium]|nr:hypothetical protein [Fibrobacterota bacterium]